MAKYPVKSRKSIYKGNIIDVYVDQVEYPNGQVYLRELIEHVPGVCIACLNDKNQLAFVKQYRYGIGDDLQELPAGKADSYLEDLLEAARRELEEECGVQAKRWVDMGKFIPTSAYLTEWIQFYFAYDLTYTHQHFDDDEFIELSWIDLDKAIQMVYTNELIDGKTIALILKVANYLTGHSLCYE